MTETILSDIYVYTFQNSLLQLILGALSMVKPSYKVNTLMLHRSRGFAQTLYAAIYFLRKTKKLHNGDKTIVGERGASLSGGQRVRISLARAVYKQASVYLLDNPLIAVDAHVGRHLFDGVIGPRGRLEKATRVLMTHQVHFPTEADWIVIVENGRISRQGTYDKLANNDLDSGKLLEPHNDVEVTNIENKNDSSLSNDVTIYADEDIPYIDGVRDGSQALRQSNNSFLTRKVASLQISSNQDLSEDDALVEDLSPFVVRPI